MRDKLFEIFREYSHKKAGYIPIEDRQGLVDKVLALVDSGCPKCGEIDCQQHGYSWQRSVLEDETDALESNMDAIRRMKFSEDIAYAGWNFHKTKDSFTDENTYQRTGDEPV